MDSLRLHPLPLPLLQNQYTSLLYLVLQGCTPLLPASLVSDQPAAADACIATHEQKRKFEGGGQGHCALL
jgi:hypothetical protein